MFINDGVTCNKIYISGPITGMVNLNREAFFRAEVHIVATLLGYPLNPHRIGACLPESATWLDFMRVDIAAMMEAESVYMLRGWWKSRGARIEWILAKLLGIPVVYEKKERSI
jgi:hypothetical protein